ncbi:MAG: DEAD/DEAH box helicase [Phycisphaerales bacterium]
MTTATMPQTPSTKPHATTPNPFAAFGLCRPLVAAIREEGYTAPTPIQARTIPTAMEGSDILGCDQTGAGKTAAFALPILHRLHTEPADKSRRGAPTPRALILAPTRELAAQIADAFETYGRHTNLRVGVVFGGVSQRPQERALQRGVDILVACPGRLIDLMEQRIVDLRAVHTFVLDEADRMLDMGFIHPIKRIASAITKNRQTLLFSATMPKTIIGLADSLLRNPVKVSVNPVSSAAPKIAQSVYMVHKRSKQALLERLLEDRAVERAIVFSRTKHGADKIVRKLKSAGIDGVAIHGNKNQNQRTRALDAFRSGRTRVLVATDVAARGIDVDDITHVFNFDLPNEPEAYVHRIGRTARAGASGVAIAFCDREERDFLQAIERLTKQRIAVTETPTDLPEPKPLPAHAQPAPTPAQRQRPAGGRRTSPGAAGGRQAARRGGRRRGGR